MNLVTKPTPRDIKTITFKLDTSIVEKFRKLTKELGFKQSSIIDNAIRKAIEEMEGMKREVR